MRGRASPGEVVMWRICCERLEGRPHSVADMEFLYEAFIRIIKGADPVEALKLQRPKGRKPATIRERIRQLQIGEKVAESMRRGSTQSAALARVAKATGISEDTAKDALNRFRKMEKVRAGGRRE